MSKLHFVFVHNLKGDKVAFRVKDVRTIEEMPSCTRIKMKTDKIYCRESFEQVLKAMQSENSGQSEQLQKSKQSQQSGPKASTGLTPANERFSKGN